jgi:hypothetical protein
VRIGGMLLVVRDGSNCRNTTRSHHLVHRCGRDIEAHVLQHLEAFTRVWALSLKLPEH